MNRIKFAIATLVIVAFSAYFVLDLGQYLTLEFVQSRLASLQAFRDENFALTVAIYFVFYVVARSKLIQYIITPILINFLHIVILYKVLHSLLVASVHLYLSLQ